MLFQVHTKPDTLRHSGMCVGLCSVAKPFTRCLDASCMGFEHVRDRTGVVNVTNVLKAEPAATAATEAAGEQYDRGQQTLAQTYLT